MGSKYQAYPEYKDSGVEWLGCIPKNWQVAPLFSVASTESIKNQGGSVCMRGIYARCCAKR